VCQSVREDISGTTYAIFTKFLCMLLMAVALSSSGRLTKSQREGAILGVFFPNDKALYGLYSGMNCTTTDRFRLKLLIYRKVGQNLISYN